MKWHSHRCTSGHETGKVCIHSRVYVHSKVYVHYKLTSFSLFPLFVSSILRWPNRELITDSSRTEKAMSTFFLLRQPRDFWFDALKDELTLKRTKQKIPHPFTSWGTPTTAASATSGCCTSACSISAVVSRWPTAGMKKRKKESDWEEEKNEVVSHRTFFLFRGVLSCQGTALNKRLVRSRLDRVCSSAVRFSPSFLLSHLSPMST